MRLLVKRGTSLVNDLHFSKGPIYIGRHHKSQVFLPDRSVSRQHAVILMTQPNVWLLKDLGSANQTLLNGRPALEVALHEGDVITIADFSLEVHFEIETTAVNVAKPMALDDTFVAVPSTEFSIYKTDRQKTIHLAGHRMKDLFELGVELAQVSDQEVLLRKLVNLLLKQFEAYHAWAGLRETTQGPLTCYGGLTRGGHQVTLEQLFGKNIIKQSLKEECYILLPNIADTSHPADSKVDSLEHLRSAMATPIVTPTGTYGVIYVDNGADQASYSHHDLDYLTIVNTLVAAWIEQIG